MNKNRRFNFCHRGTETQRKSLLLFSLFVLFVFIRVIRGEASVLSYCRFFFPGAGWSPHSAMTAFALGFSFAMSGRSFFLVYSRSRFM